MTAAVCALGMIGAVVASGSRGGFLGFAAMLVALAITIAPKRPGLILAGVLAMACALPVVPSNYYRRVASITDSSKDDFSSSAARKRLFGESFDAFTQNPITGVGAGEFKDWNPSQRMEAWHESHNVWLQVAAELGIFGLAVFLFLVTRSFYVVYQTRKLLKRTTARRPSGPVPELATEDYLILDGHSAAMAASLVGWFVCAFFASVAYNWTFYYLLALAATPAVMLRDRMPAARRLRADRPRVIAEVVRA
jgi:O-antigen ligase